MKQSMHGLHTAAGERCWRRLKAWAVEQWDWAWPLLRSFSGLPVAETLWSTYSHAVLAVPKSFSSLAAFKERVWCARFALCSAPRITSASSHTCQALQCGLENTLALCAPAHAPGVLVAQQCSNATPSWFWDGWTYFIAFVLQAQPARGVLLQVPKRVRHGSVPGAPAELLQRRLPQLAPAVWHDHGGCSPSQCFAHHSFPPILEICAQ
jgi:hypothetical protein